MRVLFLDQSGKLGGAELSLLDVASAYVDRGLVVLFEDGPYRQRLEQADIPVKVISGASIAISKDSGLLNGLGNGIKLLPLIQQVAKLAQDYDVIYANTQKAFVVGAIAAFWSRRPLIYHLRDILSESHFSRSNIKVAITLANRFASAVITNSIATQQAFIAAGGRSALTHVIYNGFQPEAYQVASAEVQALRQDLGLVDRYVVGHFSRLSPWKGQHVLIEALRELPDRVVALLVGDALFGEDDYVQQLQQQSRALGLADRVKFLGFRSEIPQLMAACDLVTHTSTAPEPFGRVIIEAMLCGVPVIAAAAGGAIELVEPEKTGWLCPPGDSQVLAQRIQTCLDHPQMTVQVAQQGQQTARQRFSLIATQTKIAALLQSIGGDRVG